MTEIYTKNFSQNGKIFANFDTSLFIGYKSHKNQIKWQFDLNKFIEKNEKTEDFQAGHITSDGNLVFKNSKNWLINEFYKKILKTSIIRK